MTKALSRVTRTVALGMALAMGVAASGVVRAQEVEATLTEAPSADLPALSTIGESDILFTALVRDWTRADFEAATRFYPPPSIRVVNELEVPFDKVLPSQVHQAIGQVVTNLSALEEAKRRGLELPPAEALEEPMRDIAIRTWLREKGVIAATIVTDEELLEFRDRHADLMKIEEELKLRHLFFPAYEDYTVAEGDTLVSIAAAVSGDEAKASQILSKETREPRAGANAPETGKSEPDEPLVAGEVLLVPMNEEKAAEVEAKARAAWQRVVDGEDFVEVAKDVTGNPNAASLITVKPASDAKPMLPPLREAFDALEDGAFSEPVRTRHGFQVVLRESHHESRPYNLEEVRQRHLMDLRQEKAFNAYLAALREIWAEADFIEVNEEALAMAGKEEADTQAVVFELEGAQYLVANLQEDFDGRYEELEDVAARRALLIELQQVQQAVLMWDIERQGIRDRPNFKLAQEVVESTMVTPRVLDAIIEEKLEEPTEEDLRARFDEDSAQFTKVPSAFIWRISVTADTEAEPGTEEYRNAVRTKMMELSQALAEIKDVTGFEKLAREMSEDEFATMSGRVGRVNSFQEEGYYAPVIERMNGQGVVGPIIKDRLIQGYWVEEVFDTSETAFQDVRELVRNNEMEVRKMRIGRAAERELIENAGLKIFFDPEKTSTE